MIATHKLRQYTDLIYSLAYRDIRARYRRSILGPAWAILQPILLMVAFTALSGVLSVSSGEIPYVIFSYSVLVPWTFFTGIVSRAAPSIITNASIIKKIALPRELFPLAGIATSAFDLLMASLVLIALMIGYGVPLNLNLLWLIPLTLLLVMVGLGLGLIFASLGVYWRDILQVTPFFLQLLMYATPIIYPLNQIPDRWRDLYQLNPLVGILEGYRRILAQGEAPDLNLLWWSALGGVLILGVSLPVFRYMARYFADVL